MGDFKVYTPKIVEGVFDFDEFCHLMINGEVYHPGFNICWVAQQTSWLLIMSYEFDNESWNCPEYQDSPLLTNDTIKMMIANCHHNSCRYSPNQG